jgi:dipeptidyl aminopeptidase/acylaminoacyl peptidase
MRNSILLTRMKHRTFPVVILIFLFFLIAECVAAEKGSLTDPQGVVIHRELLSYSPNSNKKVELFWAKPSGNGPYAAVLFIHGHQEQVRDGGKTYAKVGRLGRMVSRGYVAAAISQPGYGNSDGPPDFCGPFTQQAVLVAIDFLRKQTFIKPDKIALYGYSRGAIVASMVATQDQRLAAVILGAGAYDFFKWYPTPVFGIDTLIKMEAGISDEVFKARSAIYYVEKIRSPILLLHGGRDERVPVRQAEAFAEKLKANGIVFEMKIFPYARHSIPTDEQYNEVYPFLEKFLVGLNDAKTPSGTACKKNDIVSTFSGRTVCFEKWIAAKQRIEPFLNDEGFIEIYVGEDGFAQVRGKKRTNKLAWTADDSGNFCIGMDERKVFWGCKRILKLEDGSFYGKGDSAETSGKISIK